MAFLFEAQTKEKKNIVFICNTNFHQIDNVSAKETIMTVSYTHLTLPTKAAG